MFIVFFENNCGEIFLSYPNVSLETEIKHELKGVSVVKKWLTFFLIVLLA